MTRERIAKKNPYGQWRRLIRQQVRVAGTARPVRAWGATLNAAVGMGAYALSDRASWGAHANKADFKIMVEGDQRLFNPYGCHAC